MFCDVPSREYHVGDHAAGRSCLLLQAVDKFSPHRLYTAKLYCSKTGVYIVGPTRGVMCFFVKFRGLSDSSQSAYIMFVTKIRCAISALLAGVELSVLTNQLGCDTLRHHYFGR